MRFKRADLDAKTREELVALYDQEAASVGVYNLNFWREELNIRDSSDAGKRAEELMNRSIAIADETLNLTRSVTEMTKWVIFLTALSTALTLISLYVTLCKP